MDDEIESAVKKLVNRVAITEDGAEAMRLSQAALNVANAAITLVNMRKLARNED